MQSLSGSAMQSSEYAAKWSSHYIVQLLRRAMYMYMYMYMYMHENSLSSIVHLEMCSVEDIAIYAEGNVFL